MAWWNQLPQASPLDAALAYEGVTGPLAQLARSVYQQESSGGRNTRTSNAGAVGGMQILPGTFREVADDGWDINDPIMNARAGIRYLQKMQERGGGDPRMAAIGYYGGPGAIDAARRGQARSDPRNPHAPNTFQYADQVMGRVAPQRKAGPIASALDRASEAVFPAAHAGQNWWESMPLADEESTERPQASDQQRTQADDWWESLPLAESEEVKEAPKSGGYLKQVGSGLLEGFTGALGAPVDLTNAAIGLGARGINAAFGTNIQPSQEPWGGSRGLRRGLPIAPPSDQTGPQMARRTAQSVGGAIPFLGNARSAQQLFTGLGTALGGGLGGATAQQLFPGNIGAEIAGEVIGGIGTGGAIAGLANRSARRAAEKAVPTVEQLRRQASEQYAIAERNGVTATQAQTKRLADDFRRIAQQEGLVTPTGRVSEAYPRAAEALRVMDDYATGAMTPTQMQVVRDTLSDAANATKGKERRIATIMLNAFDEFTAPLAPSLEQARGLYSRAARGNELETLRELAGARAGQFSGSGFENALRTEYRGLDRRITKGQSRGWTPEQVDAIQKVARGTRASNAARNVGRVAPTGVVSMGLGGGFPFMVGNAVGGPALGSTLSGLTMGTGFAARDLATRMGISYAEAAELLARNGGLLSGTTRSDLYPALLWSTLGGQAGINAD